MAVDHLMQLTETLGFFEKNKLNLIILDKIPSYKDWLDISGTKNEISVFANADIYFDESINKAFNYLKNEKSLICLIG